MFYDEVIRSLNSHGVRYLVVGGVAINLHGIPRMTYDLDLMIALDPGNVRQMIDSFQELGYYPRLPVQMEDFAIEETRRKWRKEKNMLVFSLTRGAKEFYSVDIFTENPLDFDECFARRKVMSGGNCDIPVAATRDLITMKRLSNRAQDVDDIESLEKLGRVRGT